MGYTGYIRGYAGVYEGIQRYNVYKGIQSIVEEAEALRDSSIIITIHRTVIYVYSK